MESIFSGKNILQQDCFMEALDLQDVYLQMLIRESSQKCLRLAVDIEGVVYL